MAFNRKIRVTIGDKPDGSGGTAVVVEDLHMRFSITRSQKEKSSGELTIYNLSEESQKRLSKKNLHVIIEAGYEDSGFGSVFVGNVTQSIHYQDGPERVSDFKLLGGMPVMKNLETATLAVSFARGASLAAVLSSVATNLGMPISGTDLCKSFILPNGLHFTGRTQKLYQRLRSELAARQLGLMIDMGQIIVYRPGQSGYTAVYLDKDSGLLSAREKEKEVDKTNPLKAKKTKKKTSKTDTGKTVVVQSVLIPSIRPGGKVQIQDKYVAGIFVVETVSFLADNFGEEWTCSMEVWNG